MCIIKCDYIKSVKDINSAHYNNNPYSKLSPFLPGEMTSLLY